MGRGQAAQGERMWVVGPLVRHRPQPVTAPFPPRSRPTQQTVPGQQQHDYAQRPLLVGPRASPALMSLAQGSVGVAPPADPDHGIGLERLAGPGPAGSGWVGVGLVHRVI